MIRLELIPRSSPPALHAADSGVAQGGTTLNTQPATASAAAPTAPAPQFPQASRPAIDLASVRTGLRTIIETTVVDLSVAHSIAGGNALFLALQGTAYYIDKGADVGLATIHIQDQTTSPVNSINVFPGDANNNIAFTFWMIENTAQPGKVLRIHYGTDIIFQPGIGGNVVFTGGVAITQTAAGAPQNADQATANGKAYALRQNVNAVAAQISSTQLFNPGGSGKRVYVDQLFVNQKATAGPLTVIYASAALPTAGTNPTNKKTGAGDSAAQGKNDATGASAGNSLESVQIQAVNGEASRTWASPIILDPGFGLTVSNTVVNEGFFAHYHFREY